jgi:hypothetical protein
MFAWPSVGNEEPRKAEPRAVKNKWQSVYGSPRLCKDEVDVVRTGVSFLGRGPEQALGLFNSILDNGNLRLGGFWVVVQAKCQVGRLAQSTLLHAGPVVSSAVATYNT